MRATAFGKEEARERRFTPTRAGIADIGGKYRNAAGLHRIHNAPCIALDIKHCH
jgi:hypothetical protein